MTDQTYTLAEATMDLTVYEGDQLIIIEGKIMGKYRPGPSITSESMVKAAVDQFKQSNHFFRWTEDQTQSMNETKSRQAQINKIYPQAGPSALNQPELELGSTKAPRNYSLPVRICRVVKDRPITQYEIGQALGLALDLTTRQPLRLALVRLVRDGTLLRAKGSHGVSWEYTKAPAVSA